MLASSSRTFDLAVVGAGIFGLSIAREAMEAGLRVVVLEAGTLGSGASGGLLGALMPHMPARWNPKKQFQFDALTSIGGHLARLEAETGLSAGYRACGRILPIVSEERLDHHRERSAEAAERWVLQGRELRYDLEPCGARADWLAPEAAPFGLVHETLAARVAPRAYLAALAEALRHPAPQSTGGVPLTAAMLLEDHAVTGFDPANGHILVDGRESGIVAEQIVLTAGFRSFHLLQQVTGQAIGRGEKGQALLLDGQGLEDRPAVYCDGLYVVPHDDGTVAVGSTSERHEETTHVDMAATDDLLTRARAFCPALEGRQVLERWAGVRPRCNKRDPLVGRVPGQERMLVATGGFKISFGIAHRIAEALVDTATGRSGRITLPDSFRPEHHFA